MVKNGASSQKTNYISIFPEILNPEGHQNRWFNSCSDFAEWVHFAYWWSCIEKGLRLQPVQQACLLYCTLLYYTLLYSAAPYYLGSSLLAVLYLLLYNSCPVLYFSVGEGDHESWREVDWEVENSGQVQPASLQVALGGGGGLDLDMYK